MNRSVQRQLPDAVKSNPSYTRRAFLCRSGMATVTAAVFPNISLGQEGDQPDRIPLGFDNFSLRAHGWKAKRLIEFAAEQKLDSVLFSDLDVYENHDAKYLLSLKQQADDAGIVIHAGTGGICPTAKRFIKKWGTAKQHLELGIRIARELGSPVFRCYLGGSDDRKSEGGIARHIDETIKVLKSVEAQAVDANVKIAVENHAGDMQARELVQLIKSAGPHFVGATIDSGNATWTLESPLRNLELLGSLAVTSGMRDSTVWPSANGATVAWNAVGEGQVDWKAYCQLFARRCPGVPFQLEIISGFNREVPFKRADFWEAYADCRAVDFESFLSMMRRGKAIPAGQPNSPEYQMNELLRSIRYCKQQLGLGLK